jgi:uncharacterized protein YbjT (DUF2867 family)
MNVLLFGATGMVGRGVLRECLLDPGVQRVTAIVRRPTGQSHGKLREVVQPDVADLSGIEGELSTVDACFFCLGVSAVGMSEEEYTRLTHGLTLGVAEVLARANPRMAFVYVSGAGTDEGGRMMWARVKGRTENALLALPFAGAYMFRPGAIVPLHGIRSSTGWYNAIYSILRPLLPVLRRLAPGQVTTTELLGRAILAAARSGAGRGVYETRDIDRLARGAP